MFNIVLANLAVSLISFSGAAILLWKKFKTDHALSHLVSFAAGVMLAAAILDLLPEAVELAPEGSNIFVAVISGILLFFFLERFLLWFHHHDETHGVKPTAALVLVGDGIHNFIDGLAIAATFITSPALGFVTTLAIAAHEIPQEIADFSILIYGGMKKKKALIFNFLSGLTALLGGILGFYFLDKISGLLPLFLAFTAGMFIYISCADLIPELHRHFEKKKGWSQSLSLLCGVILLWILTKVLSGT